VHQQWRYLELWLQDNLPEVAADLNPGCSEAALAELETLVGKPLPEDVKAFYRIHDGQFGKVPTGLFYGLLFLSLAAATQQWLTWKSILDRETVEGLAQLSMFCTSAKPGAIKEIYANRFWVPFAYDFAGNHLGIDLDPGPNGVYGQVINFGRDEDAKFVLANSFAAFIEWMIDQLKAGNVSIKTEADGSRSYHPKMPETGHILDSLDILFADQRGA
jgi:cell wall assembly regulator SMI1